MQYRMVWTRPEYFIHRDTPRAHRPEWILWPSVIIRANKMFFFSCGIGEEHTYRRTNIFHRGHCRDGNKKNHTDTTNKMVLHREWMSSSSSSQWPSSPSTLLLLVHRALVVIVVPCFDRLTFYFCESSSCRRFFSIFFSLAFSTKQ